jgi:GDPmannose 4,6-dehydratase
MAELLLERGYCVVGLVRPGGPSSLERIAHLRSVELVEADLASEDDLRKVVSACRPAEIYNLAARASSSHLFEKPVLTADYNALAVARLLEAIRVVDPTIRFCQAGSSEVFGNAFESPQSESTPFRPRNPYGLAKQFAHGLVGTYREAYGLFACASILFNHESPRRRAELVTRKISMGVARIRGGLAETLQLGNLDARRDWGFAGDYVRGMWLMLQADKPDDYVLATGETHTVRDFCEIAFSHVRLDYRKHVVVDANTARPPDAVHLVGDATKARTRLGWKPTVSFEQLVRMMVDSDVAEVEGRVA